MNIIAQLYNKYKLIIFIVIILLSIFFILYRKDKEKMVYVFPYSLKVHNHTEYDVTRDVKIISQEIFGYTDIEINIFHMHVENFDPTIKIKAFVVPHTNGNYSIFIKDNIRKDEIITIICHEMVHIYQFEENLLEMIGLYKYIYKGKLIDITQTEYWKRSFEKDARIATDTIRSRLRKLR